MDNYKDLLYQYRIRDRVTFDIEHIKDYDAVVVKYIDELSDCDSNWSKYPSGGVLGQHIICTKLKLEYLDTFSEYYRLLCEK